MENIMLVLTLIGTIATVISTFKAIRAKNEAKIILKEIKNINNQSATTTGTIDVKNNGLNSGVISGVNTGEINGNAK